MSRCATVSLNGNSILAFCFDTEWSIDEEGTTTRVVSGYLQIPVYISSGRWTTADVLRDRIQVPIPIGFQRKPRVFKLSEDRSTRTFTITDVQILPEQLPLGCTDADGTFEVQNANSKNLSQFEYRASATYKVSPDQPRIVAQAAFFLLLTGRIQWMISRVNEQGQMGQRNPMLTSFRAVEGLYRGNRSMSFSATYLFDTDLKRVLREGGFWREVPNTNNALWVASVGNILGNRGTAGCRFNERDDIIINLCGATQPTLPNDNVINLQTHREQASDNPRMKTEGYLRYENVVDVSMSTEYVTARLLTTDDRRFTRSMTTEVDTQSIRQMTTDPTGNPVGGPGFQQRPDAYKPPAPTTTDTESMQARATPGYELRMRGVAVRAGKPAPVPSIVKFGNRKAVPCGEQWFEQRCAGVLMGVPIYVSRWILPYTLVEAGAVGGLGISPVVLSGYTSAEQRSMSAEFVGAEAPNEIRQMTTIYQRPGEPPS